MKVTDLLPGIKVDINVVQLQENDLALTNNLSSTYYSSIYDITDDGSIELYMPTEEAKLRILPKNIRYEFVFHMERDIYKADGTIVEHLKHGSVYILKVELSSEFKKFQRREYFRLECIIPMTFTIVSEETAYRETTEQVFYDLAENNDSYKKYEGTLLDISGGGTRFVTYEPLDDVKFIFVNFTILQNKKIEVIAEIISTDPMPNEAKFIHRTKFLFKDNKTRDEIIRFVFEEERKIRKREQGLF